MSSQPRLVEVRKNVLKQNDVVARALRQRFRENEVFAVSLVSSPGSGKTMLLERTLTQLRTRYRVAALVGDLATENDAERLARSQAPVKQITTGTLCHLEAAMIERARANADSGGYTNVEFYQSTIDNIPLPDASVDCVISNCVLNLAPDKPAVFREIARILKPGGRLAISDIALKGELPEAIARSMAAYVGCIGGATRIDDYRAGLIAAGFGHVEIVDSGADLNAYTKVESQSGCCSPAMDEGSCCSPAARDRTLHAELSELLINYDVNTAAASVKVYAIKPKAEIGTSTESCCAPGRCSSNQ